MPHPVVVADASEQALGRVQHAMDRVVAAFDADDPDLVVERHQPPTVSAWHPDPTQHPVTTRQWAELTRLRAGALRQEGLQVRSRAPQLHQTTQAFRATLHRPPQGRNPRQFIRVGPANLGASTARPRR